MRLAGLTLALGLLAGPALADDTIKIGVLSDMAGPLSAVTGPGAVIAAELAVEDFGGMVAGKKIEIVQGDHQNKADVGAAIAQEWLTNDNVDVILDGAGSAVALAVQEIARNEKKIFLITGASGSVLTDKACSPYGIHWTYDTYALAHGTGKTMVEQGGDTWFFITADYAFGHALQRDTTAFIEEGGGKVLGSVLAPFPNQDFSSFLLQAQSSGAKIIGLANAGGDTINAIKQAAEFGIVEAGQKLAGLLIFITDIHSLGLQVAQGVVLTTGFYWDMDDKTREWSKRFFEKHGAMPSMTQAGVYSSTMHYLKAVEAAGTDEALAVAAKMRELPIDDFFARNGKLREDGRMVHDMYLMQVKSPDESKYPWDYYKLLATIPADEAFRPLSESECPLVKK